MKWAEVCRDDGASTARRLEIDPNETPFGTVDGHVRNLRPTVAPHLGPPVSKTMDRSESRPGRRCLTGLASRFQALFTAGSL